VIRVSAGRNAGVALTTMFVGFVAFGGFGCGGEKPPAQLPSTAARDRVATRVELVDLVISDQSRASKVRSLYIAMDALLLDTKRAQARELALLGASQANDEQTRAALAAVSQAETSALERYMGLQLELRRFTSADEFARLDAIR
jgi:hypothetical protein